METSLTPQSLGQRGLLSDIHAFWAVIRREWTIFVRYPSWIIALLIWPLIFPMLYILTARALSGPDGSGLAVFMKTTGATDYIGYIIIGTTGMDVAKHCALGCGLRTASRANERHTRIKLALPHLENLLSTRAHGLNAPDARAAHALFAQWGNDAPDDGRTNV